MGTVQEKSLPLAALLAATLAACGGGGGSAGPPNVILVTLDTTRPDYLSCYGSPNPTPAFDALAAEGARFELALSSSAVTPVSHATILTGRFQFDHGLRVLSAGSGFRLGADAPTLASVLKGAGYSTGAVHSAFPVSSTFGFDRDFDSFESLEGSLEVVPGRDKLGWDAETLQRRSDATTDLAIAFLERVARGERPFFLWIHYWDPHDLVRLPPPAYVSHLELTNLSSHLPAYEKVYATEVRYLDAQFGRLVEHLQRSGLLETTLLAVTADHGEGLADGFRRHGWSKHRMTYQEDLRVPLILRGPGIPTGVRVADMVRTADIAPTLLDYAGQGPDLGPGDGPRGQSLRPLMEGTGPGPLLAYADQVNAYDSNASMVELRPDAAHLYTVCDGEWKLTYRPHMPEASELFHLPTDPGETRNALADQTGVFLRLMGELAALDPWVLAPFPDDGSLDPRMVEALGALGYGGSGEDSGSGEWWWTCPEHPAYRRETRSSPSGSLRHDQDGCRQPVVPRTTWK